MPVLERRPAAVIATAAAAVLVALLGPSYPASGALSPRALRAAPSSAGGSPARAAIDTMGVATATVATVHLVAVGDIARQGGGQRSTAALVSRLRPQRLLLMGDEAYPSGSASDFARWFAPSYGAFRTRSWPVPGNHEYGTRNAAGYRAYFHITGTTWWAHRIGAWVVIGLDSERVSSAAQLAFLRRVLAANNGRPTLVLWHRPRYTSGVHGDAADVGRLWTTVSRDRDVRLVLWGHDHDYERMAIPVAGRPARLTSLVVGTGGAELRPFTHVARSWDRRMIAARYGVLDLYLQPRGMAYRFLGTNGAVLDRVVERW